MIQNSRASKLASVTPAKADHVGKPVSAVEATAATLGSRDVFFGPGSEVSGSAPGTGGESRPEVRLGFESPKPGVARSNRAAPTTTADLNARPANDAGARLATRFWSKVDKSNVDGCWPWLGQITRKGYGRIQVGSRKTTRGPRPAHQIAWVLTHGAIPSGLVVRHVVCGNPACCRPDHLALGTQKQNCEDTVRMGRTLVGERNHQAKLTSGVVTRILQGLARGERASALASENGVSSSLILQIRDRKVWRHIPAPANSNATEEAR